MPGSDPAAPRRARSSWLADRRFLAIFAVGMLTSLVRWTEMLALGVYVFAATRSASLTAAMTLLRLLPLALFGALGGAVADRVDRQRMMQWGLASMCALCAGLAALDWSGRIEIWHLGAAAFLGGVFWITDFPVRRALLGEVVRGPLLGRAMGVDTIANNGTRMLGPLLGGALLAAAGLGGTFAVAAALYALAWAAFRAARFRPPAPSVPGAGNVWRSIGEGLRYLGGDRRLAGILAVTVVFNLWAFPMVSMIPVVGQESFGLGPSAVGVLASAEGAGALAGALLVAMLARPGNYALLYMWGCAAYLAASIAFAASPVPWAAGAALVAVGLGGAAFAAMQTTLVLISTPPEIRGRMMGVLLVCIGTGPIGFYHLGLLADWLGAREAVMLIGIEGLVALGAVFLLWPEIRHRGALPARESASGPPGEARPG